MSGTEEDAGKGCFWIMAGAGVFLILLSLSAVIPKLIT